MRVLEMGSSSWTRTSRWRFLKRLREVEEGSESDSDIQNVQGPSGLQMHEERLV